MHLYSCQIKLGTKFIPDVVLLSKHCNTDLVKKSKVRSGHFCFFVKPCHLHQLKYPIAYRLDVVLYTFGSVMVLRIEKEKRSLFRKVPPPCTGAPNI